jgi:dihydrodipicolinate synthase/N-acetylneuraminate lyase
MDTRQVTSATLAKLVIAVPPVARDASLAWNVAENLRMIRHLEAGGVTTLLYGGNAALAHVAVSEYAALLNLLADAVAPQTVVIPSVGPTYGLMMDQGAILRDFPFPTVMLLPSRDATTPAGIAGGMRRFVDRIGRPAVLYLKHDDMVDVETVQKMANDGLISCIKYAIVRDNPHNDSFLKALIDAIGPSLIVSGMGEQPAIVHLRDFRLAGFTSGCVCIAPRLSLTMLRVLQAKDYAAAERIRQQFAPLEKLRDTINPVRVLHAAVALAGIADTGPITPFWSPVSESDRPAIQAAAQDLLRMGNT